MALTSGPELEIEAALRDRTGRDCVYVTSGRLGLYLALVTALSPGERVLMSPITDDVVLFTVLAAGLRPVMAPVSPEDGNIEPKGVSYATWASIEAVMTTNLYGLPDRLPELRSLCDRHGVMLVEDAAHALHTDVAGRAVGSYGEVSVFSLSKHLAGVGGVISFADSSRRSELVRLRDQFFARRPLRVRTSEVLRSRAMPLLDRTGLGESLRSARRVLASERREHRMPLRPGQLRSAVNAAPGLDPFDSWVRVDKFDYRLAQRGDLLAETVERLRSPAGDRAARIEGVKRLRELPAATARAKAGDPLALFRMPLLVEDRDAAAAALEAAGHPLHYVYDPPLDDYAGSGFVDPSPAPEAARWWARHVLPVDPLLAQRALDALRAVAEAVRPAAAPVVGMPGY
jgi:DegT/DnrJ/EryC1/StrS aminotransferase family